MDRLIAVTLTSEADAKAVREGLLKLLKQYGYVSRGDYLSLVGIQSSYSDEKVGWTELKDVQIKQVGEDEFLLDLPEATKIS